MKEKSINYIPFLLESLLLNYNQYMRYISSEFLLIVKRATDILVY